MFCYQCQETRGAIACTGKKGICGISENCVHLQDLTLHLVKGMSFFSTKAREKGIENDELNRFIIEVLFETVTNVVFSEEVSLDRITKALELREAIKQAYLDAGGELPDDLPACATWTGTPDQYLDKAKSLSGQIDAPDEDTRSARALIVYGLKGMAAYTDHAFHLGYEDANIYAFTQKAMAALTDDSRSLDDNIGLVRETGKFGVDAMALLDKANTETYGTPEISTVDLGVGSNPGILISGHDLKDLDELLKQSENSGVDIYTHGEMLPAHSYPLLKKYDHLKGNYGGAWHEQKKDFETFNGPVLLTSNCLVPPKDSYKERLYTTGLVRFDGVTHIEDRQEGAAKDFSKIIEQAKACPPPEEIETGEITCGFAHQQVLSLAEKVIDAVKSGAIKKFVVMAGCDGRMKSREYYTQFAEELPSDTIIMTAGCAKFRYNKLSLGDIGGIPRVLDAGQCNDSYSLAVIALKLKEVFGLKDINELPIVYNIAWYEQKAVLVLLALLSLGVKNIHLGPTLPALLSPNALNALIENFGMSGISTVNQDMQKFMA
ncbi:MAG: hydroxylamine reductase [Desulfobacterales bacterium]|nr:hydroxylamine reductase [Desulfobacterales bacterium]